MEGLISGEVQFLDKRGISEETCRKFGYQVGDYVRNGKTRRVHIAPYHWKGELVAQHLRTKDKEFPWLGQKEHLELFGQHLWPTKGKRIVITEGEIDCMSVSQAFNNTWPTVSLPNGAQSAAKYLKANLEFLEGYDEIVLAFDNDEPGRLAIEECAPLFTCGKVKVAQWSPFKDANEAFQKDGVKSVTSPIWNAQVWRPDGIISGNDLTLEELLTQDEVFAYSTPYPQLNAILKDLRKGELTTLTAGSGIGKSTLAREIAFHLMTHHSCKIGYVVLEEDKKKSALGFMAMHLNVPMGSLFMNRNIVPVELFKLAYEETVHNDKLFLYDHFGSLDSNNLLAKLKYLAIGCDVDFIVLDHISIVVSGIEDGDERRIIDNLMTNLRSLVENTGVGMILISHLKVPEGTPHEEGGRVTLNQLRGSGSIKQLSDNIIGLERNQQGDSPNQSRPRVLKNRLFGITGLADLLEYNTDTGRLVAIPEDTKPNCADTDVSQPMDLLKLFAASLEADRNNEEAINEEHF